MTMLSDLGAALAANHAAGDHTPVTALLTMAPATVQVMAVDAAGGQVRVKWPDGTIEGLTASEIEAIADAV